MTTIDLSYLNSIAAGEQDFVNEILRMFVQHTIPDFNSMKSAYEEKNFTTCSSFAHKMKSAISMLGNSEATELVSYVEHSTKQGATIPPDLAEKVKRLEEVIHSMSSEINQRLQTS